MKSIKKIFLTGTLLFLFQGISVSIPSYASSEDYGDIFTVDKNGERVLSEGYPDLILELIDLRCLDTWCEGSTYYYFHTFQCSIDKGECFLAYEAQARDEEAEEYECNLEMKSMEPIIQSISDFSVSDELYKELVYCIDGIEI